MKSHDGDGRSPTMAERGRLGGQATYRKHGAAHMSAIGKVGFSKLGGFARGGRRVALIKLAGWGRLKLKHPLPPVTEAEVEELYQLICEGRAS
jgi:hypothetical protein